MFARYARLQKLCQGEGECVTRGQSYYFFIRGYGEYLSPDQEQLAGTTHERHTQNRNNQQRMENLQGGLSKGIRKVAND